MEEINNMGKTIAQELIDEGIEIGTITTMIKGIYYEYYQRWNTSGNY